MFGGNDSYRRPHTPTSFCGRDKVAAIRPRGSALQLASCRLGDDCQGPNGGRINSSCSAWRCAGPVGALAAARGQTTPLVLSGAGVRGSFGSSPRAARKTRQFGSCGLRVVLTHGPRGGTERSQEVTGGECHKLATLSPGFLFFSSFFSYDSRFIQVTAVQRSPRSLVDGNVPTVLVRLEIRFPLSGVPV